MAAENLGYLGQFLGGLAAGKQMKQKKQLQSADLAYKKQRAEYESADRKATADYRANQLGLGRLNFGLAQRKFEQEESGGDLLPKSVFATRDRIIQSANEYEKQLRDAPSATEWERINKAAKDDLGSQMRVLGDMSATPAFSGRFKGTSPENLKGMLYAGIPSWVMNDKMTPAKPDFFTRYKPDRAGLFDIRNRLGQQGNPNKIEWLQNEMPQYMRIVEDLGGNTDPVTRRNAIARAVQYLGPMSGADIAETTRILETGQIDPMYQTNEDNIKQKTLGMLPGMEADSYSIDQQPLDAFGNAIPQLEPELPRPDLPIQSTGRYQGSLPIPANVTRNINLLPADMLLAETKAKEASYGLEDRLTKTAYETLFAKGRVDVQDQQKTLQEIKILSDNFKLKKLPETIGAQLEQALSSAAVNRAKIPEIIGKFRKDGLASLNTDANMKGKLALEAESNFFKDPTFSSWLQQSQTIGGTLVSNRDLYGRFVGAKPDASGNYPTGVDLGPEGAQYLANAAAVRKFRGQHDDAIKKAKEWDDKTGLEVSQQLDAILKGLPKVSARMPTLKGKPGTGSGSTGRGRLPTLGKAPAAGGGAPRIKPPTAR